MKVPHWRKLIPYQTPLSANDLNQVAAVAQAVARSGGANVLVDDHGIHVRSTPADVPDGQTRPAKITVVTTSYGPPSAHEYDVEFLDPTGGTAENLTSMQNQNPSIRYEPLAVDDVVLVVYKYVSEVWVIEGFLRPESPQFMICACS